MMEFTFDGMVRYGFGFYNPNHAAALFCAILPFLWAMRRRWLAAGLSMAVVILLALTFSRTGMAVLLLEGAFYFGRSPEWRRKPYWPVIFGLTALGIFAAVGVFARLHVDAAALNRVEIYRAGAALFAANPWGGVGFGHSGILATAALLPAGITCRTLVNSHLTLLAEWGMGVGLLWLGGMAYALLRGWRKRAAWTAFAGLTVSAALSSVFDWGVLLDWREGGGLPRLNFLLSWGLLSGYFGLGIYLGWGAVNWRRAGGAGLAALAVMAACWCCAETGAPYVVGKWAAVGGAKPENLVLADRNWSPRITQEVVGSAAWLPLFSLAERETLPSPPDGVKKVWLFGEAAWSSENFPGTELIFVSPPEFFVFPAGTARILVKPFAPVPADAARFRVELY